MTSHSQSAAVGARRRPSPPRPAAAPQFALAAPVTYVPDEYDPTQQPVPATSLPGQFGIVYPSQRTAKGVWITLLVIVTSVVAFVGWRAQLSGASDSSAGLTYTSTAAHFAAHFPAQPTETVRTEQHGGLRFAYHDVMVPGAAVITEGEITGRLPARPQQVRDLLIRQIATNSLALTGVHTVSWHGSPARQGNLVEPTGEVFTVLVIAPSVRRYYLLAAPLGAQFEALKDSFRVLS
jgi:hypothetical protein